MADVKKPISSQPEVCTLDGQEHINYTSNVVMACVLQNTVPMVVGGNKNANNRPIGADGKRDWSFR